MGLVEALLNGKLPYCNFEGLNLDWESNLHIFPPVLYYIYVFEYFLFGPLIVSIHPLFLLFEFINFILVTKLLLKFYDEKIALMGGIFMVIFPISLVFIAFIEVSIFAFTSVLASLYFFLNDKPILSSISAALGTMLIYLPGIIILPITIYYLKKKDVKRLSYFIFAFILTVFLICLPFLLICPDDFISSISSSLNSAQSDNISNILFGSYPQQRIITILNFEIKLINFFQIGIVLLSILYFNRKFKQIQKEDVIFMTIFYIFLIMVLTLYIHPRFIYWAYFLIILVLPYNTYKQELEIKLKTKLIYIFSIILIFTSIICISFTWNVPVALNERTHMNLILTFLLVYTIIWLIFGLILFNQKPLFVKMFVYCSYSIFSFILYKLSYEYSNIYQYNIYISYFIILFIVYLIYVLNFKYINQLMKTRRKHRVMEIQQ